MQSIIVTPFETRSVEVSEDVALAIQSVNGSKSVKALNRALTRVIELSGKRALAKDERVELLRAIARGATRLNDWAHAHIEVFA